MTTYVTPTEAAELVGRSRRTIDKHADKGRLTRYREGVSNRVRYDADEVRALFAVRPITAEQTGADKQKGASPKTGALL